MKRVVLFSIWIGIAMMTMISCKEDTNIPVTGLNIENLDDPVVLVVGDTYEISVSVEPSNATEQGVIWTSSNPSVASVLGGVVTAALPGITEIVATTIDGAKSISLEVIVTNPVEGIVFASDLEIAIGETVFPKYGFMPPSAVNKNIRWSSSDPSIASVDASTGEITGIAFGTVTITAVSLENEEITGSCTVDVLAISVTGVTLTPKTVNLLIGQTATLQYTTTPANAGNQDVTWSTGNADVATVDEVTGLITAIAVGEATITVKTDDGEYTDNCLVTVNEVVQGTEFVRVDANLVDWSGDYLVVYEGKTNTTSGPNRATLMAFNGGTSGPPMDGAGNFIEVTITGITHDETIANIVTTTGGVIELNELTDAAKVTIAPATGGGWSIKTNGGYYIGGSSTAGGLNASETLTDSHVHNILIGDVVSAAAGDITFRNYAIIKSVAPEARDHLRINSGTGRFGYWTDTQQHPIALYKLQ